MIISMLLESFTFYHILFGILDHVGPIMVYLEDFLGQFTFSPKCIMDITLWTLARVYTTSTCSK